LVVVYTPNKIFIVSENTLRFIIISEKQKSAAAP